MNKKLSSAETSTSVAEASSKPSLLNRKCKAALLASGLMLGLPSADSYLSTGRLSPRVSVGAWASRLMGRTCGTVSDEAFAKAKRLLSTTASTSGLLVARPLAKNLRDNFNLPRLSTPEEDTDFFEARQRIAEANGLSLVDFRPYKAQLLAAHNTDQAIEAFGSYLSNYGMTPGITRDFMGKSSVPIQAVDFLEFRFAASNVMRTLSGIPDEVVRLPKTERFLFFIDAPLNGHVGRADVDARSIMLSLGTTAHDPDAPAEYIGHEFGHLMNNCGTSNLANMDPRFTKFNPRGWKYGEGTAANAASTYGITDVPYGASAPSEDYACIFGRMAAEGIPTNLTPILSDKFSYVSAQIEQDVPGATGYFLAVGQLPQ